MNTPTEEHPQGPSAVIMQRVIAAIVLGMAFLVLGSVFVPADSAAAPQHNEAENHDQSQQPSIHDDAQEADESNLTDEHDASTPPSDAWGDGTLSSTDPHEGLPVLGSLENNQYRTVIYSTDNGPRYSVYAIDKSEPLAVLLDQKMLTMRFPDLPMPVIATGEAKQYMFADPNGSMPH